MQEDMAQLARKVEVVKTDKVSHCRASKRATAVDEQL